jgi:hypothetical protein
MHRHARTARRPDDLEACQTIVRGLPDFFTDDVPDKIANDLDAHHGWVITKDEGVVGFAVVEYRSSRAAEILWMAARHDQRNQGSARRSSNTSSVPSLLTTSPSSRPRPSMRPLATSPTSRPAPSGSTTASSTSTPATRYCNAEVSGRALPVMAVLPPFVQSRHVVAVSACTRSETTATNKAQPYRATIHS